MDYTANLTIGGTAATASATQASINQTTGIVTFASASGTTLADALVTSPRASQQVAMLRVSRPSSGSVPKAITIYSSLMA
jgi:hypothetical protein